MRPECDQIWPNVIEAMREVGIDISHRRRKKPDLEMQLHADWAINSTAKAGCCFVPLTGRGLVDEAL